MTRILIAKSCLCGVNCRMVARRQGKILVIRGGAIGDFILTLPVLAALRQHFSQADIELLGYEHIAQIALANGLADRVRSIEARALASFFARNGGLDSQLQGYFRGFAIILSYLYDPDRIFQSNVARCSKAQFIAGPHRPNEKETVHATQVFLRPLERLAIFDADPVPRLTVRTSAERSLPEASNLRAGTRKALALHPGSGSERKNWPEVKWAELLQRLVSTVPRPFLLVGGEAEGNRLERLAGTLPPSRVEVARNLPLPELAERLAGCAAFVGHDSGITHLAAAVGLPTLVLWADSVEEVWSPRSDKVTVLRGPGGIRELPTARVLDALRPILRCATSFP